MHRGCCRSAAILCGCRGRAGANGTRGRLIFSGGVRAGIRTRRKRMKKIGFLTLLIMAMFLLVLAFPAGATGPKASTAPVPVAAAAPALAAPAAMPPHPHIHEGLEAMREAKHHLEAAEGDFHGHRHKAIEHLDAAI